MKRSIIITSIAVTVLVFGLLIALRLTSGTLAQERIHVGGSEVVFKIRESRGLLSVTASEVRPWSNGWHIYSVIGNSSDIGTSNAEILHVKDSDLVILKVGRATVEFNGKSRKLLPPVISP